MLPIACELLRAGLRGMLVVIGVGEEVSSVVFEGVGENPVRRIIGNGVSDPLNVVGKLALAARPVVLRVEDAVDKVFRGAVNDERWWRRLFAILEGVGVLGLQLGDMKDGVNSNSAGEAKSNDEEEGWEMIGKGPIFCSASLCAVQLVRMWSVRTKTRSPMRNGGGAWRWRSAKRTMVSWASFIRLRKNLCNSLKLIA